ncbi:hypothetical protein GCM10009626_20380 [Brachybacterium sacelli]
MPFAFGDATFARILPPSVVSSPASRDASNRASMLSRVMAHHPVTIALEAQGFLRAEGIASAEGPDASSGPTRDQA